MTSYTPASARTDVLDTPQPRAAGMSRDSIRKTGLVLAAGSAVWSAAMYVYGGTPDGDPGIAVGDLTGFAFQVGVLGLLNAQIRTGAIGTGRKIIRALKVERVILGLAMLWSLLHGLVPAWRDDSWLAVLDIAWPLSMFGMFLISLKVAFTGRWRGPARIWCFIAETWFIITVPSFAIFGQDTADLIGATHLLVGYVTLGLILAARPDLVEARD